MANEKSGEYRTKATIIVALASIVSAIVVIARDLSPLIVYSSVIFLLVAVVVIVSARPVFNFFKNRIEIWKHNALSKTFFNEFKGFVNDFESFVDRNKNLVKDIITILTEREYHKEFRKYLSEEYNSGVALQLNNTFYHFKKRVNKFKGNKEDFLLLVSEFENLLNIYKDLFINKLLHAVKEVGKDKVDEKLKEKYSEFRINYNDFIMRYKTYGKKVNDKFREKIIRVDKFDIAKEL